ncbi:sugar O-acyltransferase, sialic acid O-acetyltransferase NeuD family [Chitinophaga eiseniae]|uniref:Sugar O-acyltransferase, sialic acid O-acetyltransferase NeuD family n=1 Tax=Chitinophaga eiseniae TaxID=634771 RepID=A0A1T4RVM7_9BACT|nr:acetyltransferase [Chitinophaga eiseniae]SKA20040.1 sugar O-acyltransferase, sialic acid O-acetyltransferase NeuD family [Chitinophaga eiseniae]
MHIKNIVVIGSSGHGRVVADILSQMSGYRVAGFIDSFAEKGTIRFGHLSVLGGEQDLPALMAEHQITGGIVGIGDNWVRSQVAAKVQAVVPSFEFVNAIHPSAVISDTAHIGHGNVIAANAVINTNATLGHHCIINTAACIEHDNRMDDYSSVAPRVVTGGNVTIGAYTAISIGAVVKHGISIGEQSIIGAGAVVLKPVEAYSIWYGVPARKMGERKAGDKYL